MDTLKFIISVIKKFITKNLRITAMILASVLVLSISLSIICCENCKNCGNNGDTPPAGDYTTMETLNGKTAKQIYDETMLIPALENYSHRTKYYITRVISIPQAGTQTSRIWREIIFKKANNNIYYEIGNTDQSGTVYGEKGKHLEQTTFVDGVNYFYKARVDLTNNVQITNVKKRTKTEMTYDKLLETLGKTEDQLRNPVYNFTAEDFNGVKFQTNKKDASDVFFIVEVKGTKALDFARQMLKETLLNEQASTNKASNIVYKFLFTEDGKFEKIEVEFRATIENQGINMIFEFAGEISFSDVGSTIVSIPQNADQFN